MKIALIMEDSQKSKNDIVFETVKKQCDKFHHELYNYGMYAEANENKIKYYQLGILASILIEAKAADFIITGCGTGQGAQMSLNSFSNLACGCISSPLDAFLFSQVNAGNAISLAFAQGFGWGSELNIAYIIDQLFANFFGGGYPECYREAQALSRNSFREMKKLIIPPVIEQLRQLDPGVIKEIIDYPAFREMFFQTAQNQEMIAFVASILNS